MSRKLDAQDLQQMALFEKLTHARVKDCFEDNFGNMVFVVQEGQIRKALGKNVENIEKLKRVFQKKVRIIEYNSDIRTFIQNAARPVKLADVVGVENTYTMIAPTLKDRGVLIGRSATTLRNTESIIKKYFQIEELKVEVGNENGKEN